MEIITNIYFPQKMNGGQYYSPVTAIKGVAKDSNELCSVVLARGETKITTPKTNYHWFQFIEVNMFAFYKKVETSALHL